MAVEVGTRYVDIDGASIWRSYSCVFLTGKRCNLGGTEALACFKRVQVGGRGVDIVRCIATIDTPVRTTVRKLVEVFCSPIFDVLEGFWAATDVRNRAVKAHTPI